jgi:hypothetical protein
MSNYNFAQQMERGQTNFDSVFPHGTGRQGQPIKEEEEKMSDAVSVSTAMQSSVPLRRQH